MCALWLCSLSAGKPVVTKLQEPTSVTWGAGAAGDDSSSDMNDEDDVAAEAPKIELLDETRPARKVNHMAVLTRNGAAVRGADDTLKYLWRQTRQDVTITVVAPARLKAGEVRVLCMHLCHLSC
jgi:hypothetical protein